ncbi:uncharacterized protein PAC_00866 [Phialocephala subalpina]|uniref:BHLH domain-containing protein n=1 Tax=Phialocephala subalpina TaxID=576137 RepID=A0A1L7WE03_9HELO|nr:uncharacterized protein PAC_00866 [Phialocephala subalpina]
METISAYPPLSIAIGNEDSYWQFNWPNHIPYCDPVKPIPAPTCGLRNTALYVERQIASCYSGDSPRSPSLSATVDATDNSCFDAANAFGFSTTSNDTKLGVIVPSNPTSFQNYEDNRQDDNSIDEDGSENVSPSLRTSPQGLISTPRLSNHRHSRSEPAIETSVQRAKRAHTMVERNYRERLNDKIAELGLYLFSGSDTRTKPSKSLIMTKAKARLQELAKRNKELEEEVVGLRQRVAILEHITASKGKARASNG